jgi:hypothetical protein
MKPTPIERYIDKQGALVKQERTGPEPLVTLKAAAEALGIKHYALRRAVNSGAISEKSQWQRFSQCCNRTATEDPDGQYEVRRKEL